MHDEKLPLIMVVILNWNNADDTLSCLASLEKTTYRPFQVIVVDNGSEDDSLSRISSWQSPYPLHILSQKENFGFAGGVNIGIRYAMAHNADFIFLLNNDAHIAADALKTMVAIAQTHQNIGIFGPIIYRIIDNVRTDRVWFAAGTLDWLDVARIGKHKTELTQSLPDSAPTSFVTGCAMLIRRKVVEAIGEFDERFFLYFEDVDYSLRAKKVGWGIVTIPAAKVWHKVSATALSQVGSPAMLYYHHRNGMLLAQKHAPMGIKIYMHIWAVAKIAKQKIKLLTGKDVLVTRAIIAGIYDYYRGKFGRITK